MLDTQTKENFIDKAREFYQTQNFFQTSKESNASSGHDPIDRSLKSLKRKDFQNLKALYEEIKKIVTHFFEKQHIVGLAYYLNGLERIYLTFQERPSLPQGGLMSVLSFFGRKKTNSKK